MLSVVRWRERDEALALANALPYGLTAAVWTRDLNTAQAFAGELEAGYVWVNGSATHHLGAMVEETLAHFGRLDALLNDAAVFSTIAMKPFYEVNLAEWQQLMAVNLTGVFLCCRAAAGPCAPGGAGGSSTSRRAPC